MRVKKGIRYITFALLLACMMCLGVKDATAKSGSGTSIVCVNFTSDDKFSLKVLVGKGGMLKDGKQEIRDGEMVYSVSLDQQKSFTIVPDDGYKISHVWYERPELDDKVDYLNGLKNNTVSIDVESTEMVLQVEFSKDSKDKPIVKPVKPVKPVTPVEKPKKPSGNTNTDTGDQTTVVLWSFACLAGGIALIVLVKKNKAKKSSI